MSIHLTQHEQEHIIAHGTAQDALKFAHEIQSMPHADWFDMKRLEEVVLLSGNSGCAYRFARDVNGADIAALQAVVLEVGYPYHAYQFARDVDGADVQALSQVVIAQGTLGELYDFAGHVRGANIRTIEQAIINGSAIDHASTACSFAINIKGANIKLCEQAVLKHGNPYIVADFARDIPEADIETLKKAALRSGDSEAKSNWDSQMRARSVVLEECNQSLGMGVSS